jgi:hypothetical protein
MMYIPQSQIWFNLVAAPAPTTSRCAAGRIKDDVLSKTALFDQAPRLARGAPQSACFANRGCSTGPCGRESFGSYLLKGDRQVAPSA